MVVVDAFRLINDLALLVRLVVLDNGFLVAVRGVACVLSVAGEAGMV